MKFKIDLRPYPGATYFTINEHLRRFSGNENPHLNLRNVELQLRVLFNIPTSFNFKIYDHSTQDIFKKKFKTIVTKDDPILGIDWLSVGSRSDVGIKILDLSYSFPLAPTNFSDVDIVIIDPKASLGIPAGILLVFYQKERGIFETLNVVEGKDKFTKDVYLLSKVADDLVEKGIEILLRESNYKAAVLYHLIESNKNLTSTVEKSHRSKMVITAVCDGKLIERIQDMGYEITTRIDHEHTIISVANYATHSKELIEMFADRIMSL
jgi:phosphoserine aminotransferase